MSLPTKLLSATIIVLGAAAPAAAADNLGTPLSSNYGASYFSRTYQVPSLWYYGPSYSTYYNYPPPRGSSGSRASDYYRPSTGYDPYYGRAPYYGYNTPWPWLR